MSVPLPGFAMARRFRARRRIAAWFAACHAVSADEAVAYLPQDDADRAAFAELRARGIVRPAPGGYFMLLDAYDGYEAARRARLVPVVIVLAVVAAGLVMLLYRG